MWVNQGKPGTARHVLERHRFNQGRFSGAGLSKNEHMREAVFAPYPKDPRIIAKVDASFAIA